jgi:hypothetical protein
VSTHDLAIRQYPSRLLAHSWALPSGIPAAIRLRRLVRIFFHSFHGLPQPAAQPFIELKQRVGGVCQREVGSPPGLDTELEHELELVRKAATIFDEQQKIRPKGSTR